MVTPIYQWIGLRENLQETIDFPISIWGFPVNFSVNQSIDIWLPALQVSGPAVQTHRIFTEPSLNIKTLCHEKWNVRLKMYSNYIYICIYIYVYICGIISLWFSVGSSAWTLPIRCSVAPIFWQSQLHRSKTELTMTTRLVLLAETAQRRPGLIWKTTSGNRWGQATSLTSADPSNSKKTKNIISYGKNTNTIHNLEGTTIAILVGKKWKKHC
jgi:hypothetical protein